MDAFVRTTCRTIGIGGLKCPCCTDFRSFGTHAKQIGRLNKLRRSRLKLETQKEIDYYVSGKGIEEVTYLLEDHST